MGIAFFFVYSVEAAYKKEARRTSNGLTVSFNELTKEVSNAVDVALCFRVGHVVVSSRVVEVISVDKTNVLFPFYYCRAQVFITLNYHKIMSLL